MEGVRARETASAGTSRTEVQSSRGWSLSRERGDLVAVDLRDSPRRNGAQPFIFDSPSRPRRLRDRNRSRDLRAARGCETGGDETGAGSAGVGYRARPSVSAVQSGPARESRPREPIAGVGDLRPRVLLASASRVLEGDDAEAESGFLGGEVRSEPATRPQSRTPTPSAGLLGDHGVGVRDRASGEAAVAA